MTPSRSVNTAVHWVMCRSSTSIHVATERYWKTPVEKISGSNALAFRCQKPAAITNARPANASMAASRPSSAAATSASVARQRSCVTVCSVCLYSLRTSSFDLSHNPASAHQPDYTAPLQTLSSSSLPSIGQIPLASPPNSPFSPFATSLYPVRARSFQIWNRPYRILQRVLQEAQQLINNKAPPDYFKGRWPLTTLR